MALASRTSWMVERRYRLDAESAIPTRTSRNKDLRFVYMSSLLNTNDGI